MGSALMALLLASSGLDAPEPPPIAAGAAVEIAGSGLSADGDVEGAAHYLCAADGAARGTLTLRGLVLVSGGGLEARMPVSGTGAVRGSCSGGEAELRAFVTLRGSATARDGRGRAVLLRVEDGVRLSFRGPLDGHWLRVPVSLRAHLL